jgi:uncharacterized protein (DUF1810 family)
MTRQPDDPYALSRFLAAQEGSYQRALSELRAGRKQSHWSWYILPQMRGLGSSEMSVRYGIGSLAEAAAYLAHPVLGARLRECVSTMNGHENMSASQVLGEIDAWKFRSCLTLFAQVAGAETVFAEALARYFAGKPDEATLGILSGQEAERGGA